MNYVPMKDAADFGSRLILAGDLDPVYEMLYVAKLPYKTLKRFLLAYWWFYHAGVAAAIAESSTFYQTALFAFDNKWPRGAERRHFRPNNGSDAARKSILWFQDVFPEPETAAEYASCSEANPRTFKTIQERIAHWPMFGPWITFKVADMIDRCMFQPVDFTGVALYAEPEAGARIVANQMGLINIDDTATTIKIFLEHPFLEVKKAPPDFQRELRVQEAETIFCKYKSHLGGHYPIGKDRHELMEALRGRGGKLGKKLLKALEEGIR